MASALEHPRSNASVQIGWANFEHLLFYSRSKAIRAVSSDAKTGVSLGPGCVRDYSEGKMHEEFLFQAPGAVPS
jgi:hypothetical protein